MAKNYIEYSKACLNLFKVVPTSLSGYKDKYFLEDIQKMLRNGIYLSPEAWNTISKEVYNVILDIYAVDLITLNRSALYKSFNYKDNLSIEEQFWNQLYHYFSVFVPEMLNINPNHTMYVPADKLNLPKDTGNIQFTYIDVMEDKDIIEKCYTDFLETGIALKQETIKDIMTILSYQSDSIPYKLNRIKNKEIKMMIYKLTNSIPDNPIEFLRFMIYLTTNRTLIIKNKETIDYIKSKSNELNLRSCFIAYNNIAGYDRLSSIFLRYKPLFLAFKSYDNMAPIINKLRRLAIKNHKAKKPEILDMLTSDTYISIDDIKAELKNITVFKKIVILNAISNILKAAPERIYFIRNGKAWTKESDKKFSEDRMKNLNYIYMVVLHDIRDSIQENFVGKSFYLPSEITYTVPTSEKMMFSNGIPFGSYLDLGKDAVVGIHWTNVKHKVSNTEIRVDLDLHINSSTKTYGWNTYLRNNYEDADSPIYSGDMTNAPIHEGGATEAFYLSEKLTDEIYKVDVNDYSYHGVVPYKLFIGHYDSKSLNLHDQHFLLSAHETALVINSEIEGVEKFVGFIKADDEGNKKFILAEANFGKSIVSSNDDKGTLALKAVVNKYENSLLLPHLIYMCGGIITEDREEADIDLSLDKVNKDSILSLLKC